MSTPILPFAVWASGTNQNSIPANDNSLRNQILNGLVIGVEDDAPGGDADGDIYIVGDTPAGAFATFDEFDLAIYMDGTWYAFAPAEGVVVNVAGTLKAWDGAAYVDAGGGAVDSVNGQTGTVSLALEDLDDVDAAAPTDGDALTWDSGTGKWVPAAPPSGTAWGAITGTLSAQTDLQSALDGKAPAGVNVQSTASTATLTPTYSNDVAEVTAQSAALTIANPSGTAVDGHGLVIRIKDNGTARALTWGSDYRAIGVTLPTTTVLGKQHYIACIRNSAAGKMDVVAVGVEA